MSDHLDDWAQELKDTYGDQITTRLKRQIKKNTRALIRTIKNKEIEFGDFSDEINSRVAKISFLKHTLREMLSEDLNEYKDWLRACIKEGYMLSEPDEDKAILQIMEKYNNSRTTRLRKLKGILLKKLTKYSS